MMLHVLLQNAVKLSVYVTVTYSCTWHVSYTTCEPWLTYHLDDKWTYRNCCETSI